MSADVDDRAPGGSSPRSASSPSPPTVRLARPPGRCWRGRQSGCRPCAPGWIFAPPAGAAGTPDASRAPAAAGSGLVIRIVAVDLAFDPAEFSVPAETPFQLKFDHRDVKIPHNVAIYASGPDGPPLFRGEIFSGPKVLTYDVPALPRGVHAFTCDPHPYMLGAVAVS